MLKRLTIALATLLAPVQAASQEAPVVLKPSSKWYMDYGEGHCRLARQFGADADKSVFYLEQYEPGSHFTVLAAGKPFRIEARRKPTLRFGSGGATVESDKVRGSTMGPYGEGVLSTGVSLLPEPDTGPSKPFAPLGSSNYTPDPLETFLEPEAVKSISSFELLDKGAPVVRLSLGSLEQPIAAMNACTEELITHWGLDLAEHRGRTRAPYPKNNPGEWIGFNEYPSDMLRDNKQGIVWFRLDVDAAGEPTACTIQQATDPPEFGGVVCRLIMKRAHFHPALNAQGQPMKSYWRSSVRFELAN
ncbi:Gram-negative bacterial tonB protein [Tsuneonella dongtanensis]|uniref:Gram-negative bacterial tonB protein n=1 Tax=Tsuneonella dongtanensis TaxID=692370 RepID=A0A1B2AAH9_9SPHN|nr:energy transducer TonB [Tsuneonella dongtanensis]ANY19169.1 Gram-negative bacterial tonB protein [Tsuneonella dongtanensis]